MTPPTPQEHPPTRRAIVPIAIIVLVGMTLLVGGLLLHHAESSVNHTALADEPKSVTVTETRSAKFHDTRRYIGTLDAWQEAKIGPQLASGFVDTVLVRPGSVVKRGEVLATLDCRNASAASSAIAMQARALEERQKGAAAEVSRLDELLDGGYAAPNEVEQKQAQAAANEAQILAMRAQGTGKALEVGDCILRAPFDGEVASRFVDPGTFVRPGTPIVDVIDRSVVRLTAYVPEVDFGAVPPNATVKLKILATGKEVTGIISRRAPAADLATRTVRFEVDLKNAERDIPVGTTAEIQVDVGDPVDAIELPLVAAKIRGKKATVFVIEGSVAKKLQVEVLGEHGSSLFVKPAPDFKSGSRVVTQGRSLLAHNDRVTAKVESAAPSSSKKDTL